MCCEVSCRIWHAEQFARSHSTDEQKLLDRITINPAIFGRKHEGIVRLVDIPVRKQAFMCVRALVHYGDDFLNGALVTVEPGRVRIRPHLADSTDAAET